jgi:hypothetical protein
MRRTGQHRRVEFRLSGAAGPTVRPVIRAFAVLIAVGLAPAVVPSTAWAAPRWTTPGAASIRPGAQLLTRVDARSANVCTADFVFTAGAATYLGMAAHCASTGERAAGSGCTEPTLPLGTPVAIRRTDGGTSGGTLAYSSWITMRQRRERDARRCAYNDFALVALPAADAALVNPSVPLVGGPTGLDDDGVPEGQAVYSYQPHDGDKPVKVGKSLGDGADGQVHFVATVPPGVPGDSGAGFLDARGRAFGVLATEFFDTEHSNGVGDLAAALDYAGRYGPLGPITLVPGTEPFAV